MNPVTKLLLVVLLPLPLLAQSSPRYNESFLPDTSLKQQAVDRWLARDKFLHASYSFLLTLSSQYILVNKFDYRERKALPISIGFTLSLGVGKEFYDRRRPGGYISYRDLVADLVGITLATLIITR